MPRPRGSKNKPKDPSATKKPRKAKGAAAAPEAPKTEAAPPASSQSSGATQGFKKPTADQVQRLVKSIVSMGNESRSISQAVGEKIAKAVENQHFDKKALGYAKGLYQMAQNRPEAFAITLPHLLQYIHDLDLVNVANNARGLPINGEDDDGDDGDDDQIDLEDAITDAPDEQPATGASPRLSIVPGSNAPTAENAADVPRAPRNEDAA